MKWDSNQCRHPVPDRPDEGMGEPQEEKLRPEVRPEYQGVRAER